MPARHGFFVESIEPTRMEHNLYTSNTQSKAGGESPCKGVDGGHGGGMESKTGDHSPR